jgi:hypothetical protein
VKLTVVHEAGPVVGSLVSEGWPRVLSNLKTLLETGEALPTNPQPSPPVLLGLTTDEESGR